jgi:hypothetical protein
MTATAATAVIEEIKHLTRAEQSRVIQFALELAQARQLSGEALAGLTQQMVDSENPAEIKKLREEIHRGFYGGSSMPRMVGMRNLRRRKAIYWVGSSAGRNQNQSRRN